MDANEAGSQGSTCIGIAMVLFIAGILSIPTEYFEAARMEGGLWVKFRHIILPPLSVFMFFQRQIVAGMTAGAIKG